MKLSDINISSVQQEEDLLHMYDALNDTQTDYPKDANIIQLFNEMVEKSPDKKAVIFDNTTLTYQQLDQRANQMANWLIEQGVRPEGIVGIYLSRSVELIVSILGVLKAGGAYLPINTDYPLDRIRYILNKANAGVLITEKEYIREANRLQWSCEALTSVLCVDSHDYYGEIEKRNELMRKELWEYLGDKATDDITGGGWIDSFEAKSFSRAEMDEYAANALEKIKPYLGKDKKVLEIGCASGITMYPIAPLVKSYYGTDLSQTIIDYNRAICEEKKLDNIKLRCIEAEDISLLGEGDFDVIIINSVVQAFSGFNYLRDIIKQCLSLMGPKGVLFLGDIMDLEKKDELLAEVNQYKKQHPYAKTKLDFSDEMFVPRAFFDDLRVEMPEVQNTLHSEKIHTIANELTKYRYDSILEIDKTAVDGKKQVQKNKQQFGANALEQFDDTACKVKISPTQLSNIIFTSGSTGEPKGVMVEHRSIIRTVKNTNYIDIKPEDVILQACEISFDPSCVEIFGALLNGATLCLVSQKKLFNSAGLWSYLVKNDVTIVQIVASLFHMHVDSNPELFSTARLLMLGGEVLSPSHVKLVKDACPDLKILNCYGPTENTVNTTTYEVNEASSIIPIGKPVANCGIYVFNKNDQLQPAGIAGELVVFGDGLARGYLGDDKLTTEKFVEDPFRPGQRMYKTGDLVRLDKNQNIEFLGRVDEQVKLKGHRVELSEIEKTLLAIPQINKVKVLVTKDKILCAYITLFEDIDTEALKQLMEIDLPFYMIPRYFVKMEELPLNAHGKIDKNALPDPLSMLDEIKDSYVAPRNMTEQKLVRIYESVLEKEKISVKDDFFELGGHSLLATKVLTMIHKEMSSRVRLEDIFENTSVEKLAHVVNHAAKLDYSDIEILPQQEHYDLSYAQKRMWATSQIEAQNVANNMADAFLIKGELNRKYLEESFQDFIERHEILRTRFVSIDNEPTQVISKELPDVLQYLDLTDQKDASATALEILNKEAAIPFDLENGPLLKLMLIQLQKDEHVFFMNFHHIIADGWSLEMMIKDLAASYNNRLHDDSSNPEPLSIQYKDFAAWQNNQILADGNRLKEFWNSKFSDPVVPVSLPFDHERPAIKQSEGERIVFDLGKKSSKQLIDISNKKGTTVYMTLLAMLNAFVNKLTGNVDIVIGSPVAGREHANLQNQFGLYLNTLAMRNKIGPQQSFTDFLADVKANTLEAFDHQQYPLDLLIDDLKIERDVSKSTLVDIGFTWQNVDDKNSKQERNHFTGLQVMPFGLNQQRVKADVWFHGWEENNMVYISLTYDKSLFKASTAQQLTEDFKLVCSNILGSPNRSITELMTKISAQQESQKSEDRKNNRLQSFLKGKKSSSRTEPKGLVTSAVLDQQQGFPIVITPNIDGVILSEWLKDNKASLEKHLRKNGAVLLRGFDARTTEDFGEISQLLADEQLKYMDQSSPRTLIADKVYTSTDYPADQIINMHNELSYSQDWPMQVVFFAAQPPETGGETPIADSRKVLSFLSEETKSRFAVHGVKYVRNLVDGLGLSWKEVYQTEKKEEVEAYCNQHNIQYEWISDQHLRISWTKRAIYDHPYTHESIWFNHGFFFNSYNLDEEVKESVANPAMYPSDTFYGDGSPIEPEVMEEIKMAFEKAKVTFKWQKGDILLLDNMLISHGRNSFTGERRILVSMNTAYSGLVAHQEDLQLS